MVLVPLFGDSGLASGVVASRLICACVCCLIFDVSGAVLLVHLGNYLISVG